MNRRLSFALVIAIAATTDLAAQGLPPYLPVNPVLTSRSGVYFQPYVDRTGPWQIRLLLDYGNAVELNEVPPPGTSQEPPTARFILDGEFLRLDATVIRNLGSAFVGASVSYNAAWSGFLDGFLNWYHDLIGLEVTARKILPNDQFRYLIELPDGRRFDRPGSSGFLGDVRLVAGHRHTRHWQTAVALTLPTSTGPAGYGRGVASVAAVTTLRVPVDGRLTLEGSAGLGYTPRHGDFEDLQRTVFRSGSAGIRYRFWGRQAAFVNLFYQSRNYERTTLTSLDRRELTLDYGFLLKARQGPEWFLGMTEDLEPGGPAIDLAFRIGARW